MINEDLTVELLMATEARLSSWAGSWFMNVSWFRSQMMQVLSSDPLTKMLWVTDAARQVIA